MKRNSMHIWEWVVWALFFAVFLLGAIGTFEKNLLGGILLTVLLLTGVIGLLYRLLHPELYDKVLGFFIGSVTGTLVDGIAAVEQGKKMSLFVRDEDLLLSDGERQRYVISLGDLIDAESLGREESAVWEEKEYGKREEPQKRNDKIKAWWYDHTRHYLIFHYRDRNTGEIKTLVFRYTYGWKGYAFANEVKYRSSLGVPVRL